MKSVLSKVSNKNKSVLFMLVVAICLGTYAAILCNRTMPYAEGWYSYYAKCINSGMKAYRDFDYLFPPVYIYFIAFFTRIFGYKIILLRILGVVIFAIIGVILYLCMNEVFPEHISCVAAIAACLYLQSEVVQIFYDYIRVMDIFALLATLFLLKAIKRTGNGDRSDLMFILSGISSALLTLVKQNIGVVFAVFCIIVIICSGIVLCKEKRIGWNLLWYMAAYIVPILITASIMAYDGSLTYFLKNTGSDAVAAKGGVLDVLFAWFPNNFQSFKRGLPNAFAIFLAFYICYLVKKLMPDIVSSLLTERLALFFGLGMMAAFVCFARFKSIALKFSSVASFTPYSIFIAAATIFWLMTIIAVVKRSKNQKVNVRSVLMIVIGGAYFAISWGCGMSGGLAQGQASLGVALIISLLFELIESKYAPFSKGLLLILCMMFALQCAEYKMQNTYNWWGMDEDDYWSSTYTTETIPDLSGIKMSERERNVYTTIYNIVMEHTDNTDSIYCFPQIPIFYSLCDRFDPGVRAKVQWFDVASDKSIMNDMSVFEADPPKVIIIYKTLPYAYESHENLFRDGNISATRKMRKFLMNFVMKNGYAYAGTFSSAQNNEILVYYKDSEQCLDSATFAGKGTKEDPYLIATSEDLIKLSQMVNDGIEFDGYYFLQTEDIDMSKVKGWRPIGLFEGMDYFYGTYDGNGHIIYGLKYSASENGGLFGRLGGTVCNLGIVDCSFRGNYLGVIASHAAGEKGSIINCYTDSKVSGIRAGGIADNFAGYIYNCVSVGNIRGSESAGAVSYKSGTVQEVFSLQDNVKSGDADNSDTNVTKCSIDYIQSDSLLNRLNDNVDKATSEFQEINLIKWTIGAKGYPVLDFGE